MSIGDKESVCLYYPTFLPKTIQRRWFKALLEKTGLWINVVVTLVDNAELEAHMEAYQKALAELKERIGKEKGDLHILSSWKVVSENGSAKTKNVSGLEYKRKRKWVPGLKEKRDEEKMAKRGIWKSKKKEKKDH